MMNGIEYLGGGSGGGGGGGNVDDVYVNGTSVLDSDKIAQITSYKEVTQSEYNALPATKETDGIAYFIKDSTEAEGYPPLIYSTSEREVGVWIDGKPLYQRTLSFDNITISANGFVTKDLSQFINDLDLALFHKTVIMMNGSPTELPAVHAGNQLSSYDISCVLTDNTLYLSRSSAGSITGDFKSTIWYTKTTDTAGQSIWAGNGALAHHYSTDEVIVGTWIDGKPLYEKVVQANCSFTTRFNGDIYAGDIDLSSYLSSDIDKAFVITDKSYYMPSSTQKRTFYFAQHEKDNGYGKFYCHVMYSRQNVDCVFVIQYTKTTD